MCGALSGNQHFFHNYATFSDYFQEINPVGNTSQAQAALRGQNTTQCFPVDL